MTDNKRLRPKYKVYPVNMEGPGMLSTDPNSVDSPFVLMPRKDPAAFTAMITYARLCEPDLRAEISLWLETIAEADPSYGSQGLRNIKEMKAAQIRLGI